MGHGVIHWTRCGKNIREWIFVEDHNKSILEIAEIGKAGMIYNISSGVEKKNLEVIEDIGNILNVVPIIEFVEDRKGHDFRYAIRSCNYLPGFEKRNYSEALRETVLFYARKFLKQVK